MQVTVKDVAKKAGVSISTVSRVLTGNARVSPELYHRVMDVVEELGYRPNALARGLRMRRTAVIGLLIPDISNPFFGQLARRVEEAASARGYAILLCNSQNSRQRELQYLDILRSQQVDGLLAVTSGATDELNDFSRLTGAKVLALDRRTPNFSGGWIGVDPYPGACEAIQHLLELGHQRIGVLRGVKGDPSSDERYNAIVQALEEHGLKTQRWTWSGEYTLETGVEAGAALAQLPQKSRPTAVITTSEFTAYGLIEGVSRYGLSVPENLSMVGYDNTAFAEVFRPALTVIAQPIDQMGAMAVDKILHSIMAETERQLPPIAPLAGSLNKQNTTEKEPKDIVLPTYLVKRSSTAKAPQN